MMKMRFQSFLFSLVLLLAFPSFPKAQIWEIAAFEDFSNATVASLQDSSGIQFSGFSLIDTSLIGQPIKGLVADFDSSDYIAVALNLSMDYEYQISWDIWTNAPHKDLVFSVVPPDQVTIPVQEFDPSSVALEVTPNYPAGKTYSSDIIKEMEGTFYLKVSPGLLNLTEPGDLVRFQNMMIKKRLRGGGFFDCGYGFAGEDKVLCSGECVTLGCQEIAEYCYKWSPEEGLDDPYSANPEACIQESRNYTVTVTDASGNIIAVDKVSVKVELTDLDLGPDITICQEDIVEIGADVFGAVSYKWNTGETTPFIEIGPGVPSTYTVTVFSEGGCSKTDAIQVSIHTPPTVSIIPEDPAICTGGTNSTITLSILTSASEYRWSNGEKNSSVIIDEARTIGVTVTDDNGCTANDITEVFDLSDNESIKRFFRSKGFFESEVSITGDAPGFAPPSGNQSRGSSLVDDQALLLISWQGAGGINIADNIKDVFSYNYPNAEKLYPGTRDGLVTKNENLCSDPTFLSDSWDDLNQQGLRYWAHIYNPEGSASGDGSLFLKGNSPYSGSLTPYSSGFANFIRYTNEEILNLPSPSQGFSSIDQQIGFNAVYHLADNKVEPHDNQFYALQQERPAASDPQQISNSSSKFNCSGLNEQAAYFSQSGVPVFLAKDAIPRFLTIPTLSSLVDSRLLSGLTTISYPDGKPRVFSGMMTETPAGNLNFVGYQDPISKAFYSYYGPQPTVLLDDYSNIPISTAAFQLFRLGTFNALPCPESKVLIEEISAVPAKGPDAMGVADGIFESNVFSSSVITEEAPQGSANLDQYFYSTCLPNVSYTDFNNPVEIELNPTVSVVSGSPGKKQYTKNGSTPQEYGWMFTVNTKADLYGGAPLAEARPIRIYAYLDQSQPDLVHYFRYNCNLGLWEEFFPPQQDIEQLYFLSALIDAALETGHISLDIIGIVPVLGEAADVINGVWYLIEGEGTDALLCFSSIIPWADLAIKGGKLVALTKAALNGAVMTKATFLLGGVVTSETYINLLNKIETLYPNLQIARQKGVKFFKHYLNTKVGRQNVGDFIEYLKHPEYFRAWKLVEEEIGNNRMWDLGLIKKMSDILENKPDVLKKMGGEEGLIKIIKNNKFAPCKGCSGGNPQLENIDEYLESVEYYYESGLYDDFPKARSYLDKAIKNNTYFNHVVSTGYMLRRMKEIKRSNIDRIEFNLNDLNGPSPFYDLGKRRGDILLKGQDKPIINELKSNQRSTIDGIGYSSGFRNQLKAYLTHPAISKVEDLKYSFDKMRLLKGNGANNFGNADEALTYIKIKFKGIFTHSQYGPEVFNSMKIDFRKDLLGEGNESNFALFLQKAEDLESKIYDFINIE